MENRNSPHIPVLLEEVKEVFKDIKSGYIIDCTVGYGGHSEAILEVNPNIKMICNDKDKEAIEFSKKRLNRFKDRVIFENLSFSKIIKKYEDYPVSGVLADIGVSSLQLDKKERGFSFESEVLDMRMDRSSLLSAYDVVNRYPLEKLEEIFRKYGEIREYKKAASLIVKEREKGDIKSAKALSSLFLKHMKKSKIHPATLIFQAIRIEVNEELKELEELLKSIEKSKIKEAKIAIISFHSLEDRIVKSYFKNWAKKCICSLDAFKCECGGNHSIGKILTKKPITPTKEEIKRNPRSRSSKMRVFALKRD